MIAPVTYRMIDATFAEVARRRLVETLRRTTPSMLPCEAQTAARVLYATGYRVDDYGKVVATR